MIYCCKLALLLDPGKVSPISPFTPFRFSPVPYLYVQFWCFHSYVDWFLLSATTHTASTPAYSFNVAQSHGSLTPRPTLSIWRYRFDPKGLGNGGWLFLSMPLPRLYIKRRTGASELKVTTKTKQHPHKENQKSEVWQE